MNILEDQRSPLPSRRFISGSINQDEIKGSLVSFWSVAFFFFFLICGHYTQYVIFSPSKIYYPVVFLGFSEF